MVGVAQLLDVPVAEREQVVPGAVDLALRALEPLGDRADLRLALDLSAPADVHGREDERVALRIERDRVRRARELLVQPARIGPSHVLRREDQLGREAGQPHAARVVDEREPLAAGACAARDVGHGERPVGAEPDHQRLQGADVALDLLDRDHVEARDDLADAADRVQVARGRSALRLRPRAGELTELAQVPRRDQQVALELLGRTALSRSRSAATSCAVASGSGSRIEGAAGAATVVAMAATLAAKAERRCAAFHYSVRRATLSGSRAGRAPPHGQRPSRPRAARRRAELPGEGPTPPRPAGRRARRGRAARDRRACGRP